nr:DegT/DnrJ/EryC1/StrS family aminotransferase [Desulfobacterales bacterium]
MKVPFLELKIQYKSIKHEILEATHEIYESQQFILGSKVQELEKRIAAYSQSPYAVAVSSGTDALLTSLMASDIGPGDEVITSPFTFFATIGSIVRVGAKPVFVDIREDTYNIDPSFLEEKITTRTKAIMPVHLFGQCADMDPILEVAKRKKLLVIEDAAQAIGAEYKGKRAGSLGDFGCFSFFPSKNLGAFGDAGMVTTHSEKYFHKLKILRVHGSGPKYYHRLIGGNFRMDALQAAVLLVKLRFLDYWTEKRQANARFYFKMFHEEGLTPFIKLPVVRSDRHVFNQFVIRVPERRDELRKYLANAGIGTEVYYPIPIHLQECFKYLGYRRGDFPVAEAASEKTIALPIYPEIEREQQAYVVKKIKEFYM